MGKTLTIKSPPTKKITGKNSSLLSYNCAPNFSLSKKKVYGTHFYTTDSDVCAAAAHSGAITVKQGGVVTIELIPGKSYYKGSKQHGVSSKNRASYSQSYRFVKSAKAYSCQASPCWSTESFYSSQSYSQYASIFKNLWCD